MKCLICALILSIALPLCAQTAPAPAVVGGTGSATVSSTPAAPATGFDFNKLKTELDKQKTGQERAESKNKTKKDPPQLTTVGLKLIIYLLVIVVLFFVISRALKSGSRKFLPAKFLRSLKAKSQTMEVLDTLSLGQGRMLNMVRVQNQIIVLSLAQHQVHPVLTISDEKTVKNILETLELPPTPVANFAQEVDYHLEALQKQEK